jgi:hypothetical protein
MSNMTSLTKRLMFLGLVLLPTGIALAAGPLVQNSAIANGQVIINGTGFVLPVTLQLNNKELKIVFSNSTHIVATLASTLAQGTYRMVVTAGAAQAVTTLTASGVISGYVNANGTIQTGTGFTSSVSQGTYTLTFPAGTFNGPTPPVAVVTPFYSAGNAMNFGMYSTTYPTNGSATITFNFSPTGVGGNEVPFTFIAVNGH